MGVYQTKLGKIAYSETIPDNICDSRLSSRNGDYYLVVPYQETKNKTENQGRVVACLPWGQNFYYLF
ncbi:hypothetical protein BJP37_29180 [Moorena bouillonii PNG]|uniref:Uncharacterized protein n=1 Tax=Moorena bouillonii PNG TaxID=568701 RepID=A0A1U7N9A5_9CYAN|nr:hypothetical protein BJP37_29180 [Moorena bouillonii PNG]